jgi:uncharacterized MAPEG superfamily protein
MGSPTAIALTGFITWALALLVLMESIRSKMVLTKEVSPNRFVPDNANLSPFMQRLARAHANSVESLPIFGGLMIVALVTARNDITDSLAYVLLAARVLQSLIHLASLSPAAATARFGAFAIQMGIAVFWSYALIHGFLA